MKRIFALALVMMMALSSFALAETPMRVSALMGPTGMGLANGPFRARILISSAVVGAPSVVSGAVVVVSPLPQEVNKIAANTATIIRSKSVFFILFFPFLDLYKFFSFSLFGFTLSYGKLKAFNNTAAAADTCNTVQNADRLVIHLFFV